jgi:hypothetical protein
MLSVKLKSIFNNAEEEMMKINKKLLTASALLIMASGLYGCASKLIDVRQGSEKVSVAETNQIASCQSKGVATVSVLSNVGFINRSDEAVEENLLQLARNSAVDMGGDTIVKGRAPKYGERNFEVYKCRP